MHRIACSTPQHGFGRLKTLAAAIALIGFAASTHAATTAAIYADSTVKVDNLSAHKIHAPAFAKSDFMGRHVELGTIATTASSQTMLIALGAKDADHYFEKSSSAHAYDDGATAIISLRDDGDHCSGFTPLTGKDFDLISAAMETAHEPGSTAILGSRFGADSGDLKAGLVAFALDTGGRDDSFLHLREPGIGSLAVAYMSSDRQQHDSGTTTASKDTGFAVAGMFAHKAKKGFDAGIGALVSMFHPGVMGAANGHQMALAAWSSRLAAYRLS